MPARLRSLACLFFVAHFGASVGLVLTSIGANMGFSETGSQLAPNPVLELAAKALTFPIFPVAASLTGAFWRFIPWWGYLMANSLLWSGLLLFLASNRKMTFARSSPWMLLLLAAPLFASACSDSTGPQLPATSYDLVFYEGKTLPVETRVIIAVPAQPGGVGFSCSDRLTAMNLRFSASGSFTQTESRMLVCDDGRPDAPSSDVTNGSYAVTGETLVLTEDFGDGFVARSTGRFSGADLTIYHRELWQNGLLKTTTDSPLIFASS